MKIATLALTGVALFALSTAPSMARTHHPSTPQERAETERLNEQALANAQGIGTDRSMANTDVNMRTQTGQPIGVTDPNAPSPAQNRMPDNGDNAPSASTTNP